MCWTKNGYKELVYEKIGSTPHTYIKTIMYQKKLKTHNKDLKLTLKIKLNATNNLLINLYM